VPLQLSPPIRIVAVNRNRILREGLTVLISSEPDLELVGTTAIPAEAVRLFEEMRPDLTLMDLDRPSDRGLQAIQQIRDLDPGAWVIALMTNDWDNSGVQALDAGASAILTKDLIGEQLLPLIRMSRPVEKDSAVDATLPPRF
jgi:DNA-binding NarL/FixJ family response regulator